MQEKDDKEEKQDLQKNDALARLQVIEGDITRLNVEAVVNAANTTLLGGGGVDGAIHRAAGPELLEACRKLGGCPTGEARITKGYRLPAKWVIHTVGPVWRGGRNNEAELLANCYRNCLRLVDAYGIKSVAFPSISTGAYRFPVAQASRIAVREIANFLKENKTVEKVIVVCFNRDVYENYQEAIDSLFD